MAAVVFYALLLAPALIHARFDPSVFIVAGDRYVDASQTRAPIYVHPHSVGYDGQFYYGMALGPLSPARQSGGVTFDHPAWRWQRIFYPLLSFIVSMGNARLLPIAMLGINLICLAVLGALARLAVRSWGAGGLSAWAFMVWPGFLVSLTHDTTELLACACLLGAAMAWLSGRLIVFAILAACATLTRETSSLMVAGLALAVMVERFVRKPALGASAKPALYAGAALSPVILWHFWLVYLWHGSAGVAPAHADLGLPFVGVVQRLGAAIADTAGSSGLSGNARLKAAYVAATVLSIAAFSGWVVACLPALLRRGGREGALGAGWLCMMALICLLSAQGPWIDPTAIFRAFSECWVIGWVILVRSGARARLAGGLALLPLAVMNWQLCLVQLR